MKWIYTTGLFSFFLGSSDFAELLLLSPMCNYLFYYVFFTFLSLLIYLPYLCISIITVIISVKVGLICLPIFFLKQCSYHQRNDWVKSCRVGPAHNAHLNTENTVNIAIVRQQQEEWEFNTYTQGRNVGHLWYVRKGQQSNGAETRSQRVTRQLQRKQTWETRRDSWGQ